MAIDYPPLFNEYVEFCRFNLGELPKGTEKFGALNPTTILPLLSVLESTKDIKNAIKSERFSNSDINNIYEIFSKEELNGKNTQAIKYIAGELVANISEHSKCNKSFFMAKNCNKEGFIEASFFDNGITIPGSFAEASKKDNKKDSECIREAASGTSTKPEKGRGHGLPSTIGILKDMNCDILIVSGKGGSGT